MSYDGDTPRTRPLDMYQERGLICTPVQESEEMASAFMAKIDEGKVTSFVPAAKGKTVVDILGRMPEEGSFKHLDPEFDIEAGVEIVEAHEFLGPAMPYGDGFVYAVIADFCYAKKVEDTVSEPPAETEDAVEHVAQDG